MPENTRKRPRPASYKDCYKMLECIGEGTYGVVTKATEKTTGKLVALKRIRTTNNGMDGLPATSLREIKLLKNLEHPHIIRLNSVFHETSASDSPIWLLEFDYLECDLRKFMKRFSSRRMPLPLVRVIMYQLFDALNYVHSHQIIHRDIKPSNVLVKLECDEDLMARIDACGDKGIDDDLCALLVSHISVKLADFGLARWFPAPIRPLTHEVVTLWYRAPEVVLGHDYYNSSLDIWSMGCILLELLYGRPVILGDSETETLYKMFQLLGTPVTHEWLTALPHFKAQWPRWTRRKDRYDFLRPEGVDADLKDLLDRLLDYIPEHRCTAAEALRHPWFAGCAAQK